VGGLGGGQKVTVIEIEFEKDDILSLFCKK
jgi:hypothetical protein